MCWVKIQERKMLKFSRLTILHISESNFQEEAPYLLRPPPPHRGVGNFITVLLGCTDLLYFTVLLYFLIRIFFFLALSLFSLEQSILIHPPWTSYYVKYSYVLSFVKLVFFFFPTYIVLRDTISKIWLHTIRICFVLIIHKQLYNFLCLREMVPISSILMTRPAKGTSQFKGNNWE